MVSVYYHSDILGGKADIHTGGVDLKFPHHDNEIAQAEVCLCLKEHSYSELHSRGMGGGLGEAGRMGHGTRWNGGGTRVERGRD